ncbi:MAG: SMP-30/gluconolactonase/LRE family protein [Pseudomonadota bacterium]
MKTILKLIGVAVLSLGAYLLLWPVSVDPQSWTPTPSAGYVGPFERNTELAALEFLPLADGEYGPEDVTIGADGRMYTAVHSGRILAIDPESGATETIVETKGRPLGIEFDDKGTLWIADAYRGLFSLSTDGELTLHASETSDGSPILYADDVDIAPDGRVYFSDASTRFGAENNGGTLAASLLDLMEHSDNGRILVFDPQSGETSVFAEGLTFANGVAVSADGRYLLVNETGSYAVHRYSLQETDYGRRTTIVSGLPGFPDNVNRMNDGNFWIGIVSPRSEALDELAESPFSRRIVSRLPASMRPTAQLYTFVIKIDVDGSILENLQEPSGAYATATGATELPDGRLVLSSLTEPRIAILPAMARK